MINILCYGDSNTWGQIPGSFDTAKMLAKRFDRDIRWTGVLQKILGNQYYVIEGGLNGRNTSFDETRIVRPSRNGLATLPLILEMNYPLDIIVLMLGTNDTKTEFNSTLDQTNSAIKQMIRLIKESSFGTHFNSPKVILVAPAPIHRINSEDFTFFYSEESIKKTEQLARVYEKIAIEENCEFIEAGKIVTISDNDGIHIDETSQTPFAEAVAQKIKGLFSSTS